MHTRGLNVHAEVSGTVRQKICALFPRGKMSIVLCTSVL